jgi:zinc D-Ala-D-Ala carboxypeptidase
VASHRAEPTSGQRARGRRADRSRRLPAERSRRRPVAQRVGLTSLNGPQVGIASALGLATIAAPLSGVLAAPLPTPAVADTVSGFLAAAPRVPWRSVPARAVEILSVVPDSTPDRHVPRLLAAPRTILVTRVSRASERPILPGCDGIVVDRDLVNGQLPERDLCTLWDPRHSLRADAAVALARLDLAYRARFGHDICLTDSYRTLAVQVRLKARKPGLAAEPGTSEHGLGQAVDLCDGVDSGVGVHYTWLRANAPDYGWDNPIWARAGGSKPEPWHWEYLDAE